MAAPLHIQLLTELSKNGIGFTNNISPFLLTNFPSEKDTSWLWEKEGRHCHRSVKNPLFDAFGRLDKFVVTRIIFIFLKPIFNHSREPFRKFCFYLQFLSKITRKHIWRAFG